MPDHCRKPPVPIVYDPQPSLFEPIRRDLMALKACVQALRLREELKYSPDQPRWPEGHPLGGQWKPKEGEEGEGEEGYSQSSDGFGEAPDGTPIEPVGGIPSGSHNSTVQSFMSVYCKGSIRQVMPGQFLNMTIAEVMALAQIGDPAARTCLKLLKQNEYRK